MSDSTAGNTLIRHECALCGAKAAVLRYRQHSFAYGDDKPVALTATLPALECEACGEAYAAPGAEDAQHDAICDHLGRLRPSAIKALREQHHLSQEELASLTGIGVASIKRWEKGALVQNDAMDRYLRLLATPHNLSLLRAPLRAVAPSFRTGLPEPRAVAASAQFSLRGQRDRALA